MTNFTTDDSNLIVQIQDAIAAATAAATSANAAAANASSAQASTAAAGSAVNARTQANTEQADKVATNLTDVTKNIDSDIGIPEAWSANVKRTYDVHQTYDQETQVQNRQHFNTLTNQLQTHLANLNQMTIQSLANNQNQSNLNNTLSIDRSWNINETDLAAKSAAAFTDAILAAIADRG
jgi:hypothetical protein